MRPDSREGSAPFVVTIASEKGGVGKTTLATNLAVYLKALREDLPVTIASFDNHFSVDAMFAIGGRRGASVAGLFEGVPLEHLVTLGEYGVQFLASQRDLREPPDGPELLRNALAESTLGGILILDTRPILDMLTRSALVASDLVLTPIKERSSLVNVAALLRVIKEHGCDESALWVFPSLVDAHSRLPDGRGVQDFLEFSARERGYQIAPAAMAKSPKVESLATGFSRRIYPVLTHARSTLVHRQLRDLAAFVLERFDASWQPASRHRRQSAQLRAPSGLWQRRYQLGCVHCGEFFGREPLWYCEDTARRRRHFVHQHCLERLFGPTLETALEEAFLLTIDKAEPGWKSHNLISLGRLLSRDDDMLSEEISAEAAQVLYPFLRAVSGRLPEELPAARFFLLPWDGTKQTFGGAMSVRDLPCLRRKLMDSARGLGARRFSAYEA